MPGGTGPDLSGKVAVVTGGNSGIGKETAARLAGMGAHVVIAARNPVKAGAAVDEIRARAGAVERVETIPIDLASFASVREFVDAFGRVHDRLDILVNNAGLILRKRVVTVDGHESQFQINHLSHFLLTNLLCDTLAKSSPARVVVVASGAHRTARHGVDFDDLEWAQRHYRWFAVYATTKLMNILFAREFAARCRDDGVTANAVHPGFVASNFGKDGDFGRLGDIVMPLARPFALSVEQGAATSVYLASSPAVDGVTGQYFTKCRPEAPARAALDDQAATRLWEVSAELTGIS